VAKDGAEAVVDLVQKLRTLLEYDLATRRGITFYDASYVHISTWLGLEFRTDDKSPSFLWMRL
jgi:predicted nucleic acid-binding protein